MSHSTKNNRVLVNAGAIGAPDFVRLTRVVIVSRGKDTIRRNKDTVAVFPKGTIGKVLLGPAPAFNDATWVSATSSAGEIEFRVYLSGPVKNAEILDLVSAIGRLDP